MQSVVDVQVMAYSSPRGFGPSLRWNLDYVAHVGYVGHVGHLHNIGHVSYVG